VVSNFIIGMLAENPPLSGQELLKKDMFLRMVAFF
jgi:hypothetical protein